MAKSANLVNGAIALLHKRLTAVGNSAYCVIPCVDLAQRFDATLRDFAACSTNSLVRRI